MRITRETLTRIMIKLGLYGSKEAENLYQNLLPLTENDHTGPQAMAILYNVRDRVYPDLDVHLIAYECEIL